MRRSRSSVRRWRRWAWPAGPGAPGYTGPGSGRGPAADRLRHRADDAGHDAGRAERAPRADLGATTSAVTVLRQIGASAGVAVVGALITARPAARGPRRPAARRRGRAVGGWPRGAAARPAGDGGRCLRVRRPTRVRLVAPLLGVAFLLALALPTRPLRETAHADAPSTDGPRRRPAHRGADHGRHPHPSHEAARHSAEHRRTRRPAVAGGKGANLGELIQGGFPVPDGRRLHRGLRCGRRGRRPRCGDRRRTHRRRRRSRNPRGVRRRRDALPDALVTAILEAYRDLGDRSRSAPARSRRTCPARRSPASRTRTSTSSGTTPARRGAAVLGLAVDRACDRLPRPPGNRPRRGAYRSRRPGDGRRGVRRSGCSRPNRSPETDPRSSSTPAAGWARRCPGWSPPTTTSSTQAAGSATTRRAGARW